MCAVLRVEKETPSQMHDVSASNRTIACLVFASPQAVKVITLLKDKKARDRQDSRKGQRPAQTAEAYMGGNSLKLQAMP